jgi:hypothetical protein
VNSLKFNESCKISSGSESNIQVSQDGGTHHLNSFSSLTYSSYGTIIENIREDKKLMCEGISKEVNEEFFLPGTTFLLLVVLLLIVYTT